MYYFFSADVLSEIVSYLSDRDYVMFISTCSEYRSHSMIRGIYEKNYLSYIFDVKDIFSFRSIIYDFHLWDIELVPFGVEELDLSEMSVDQIDLFLLFIDFDYFSKLREIYLGTDYTNCAMINKLCSIENYYKVVISIVGNIIFKINTYRTIPQINNIYTPSYDRVYSSNKKCERLLNVVKSKIILSNISFNCVKIIMKSVISTILFNNVDGITFINILEQIHSTNHFIVKYLELMNSEEDAYNDYDILIDMIDFLLDVIEYINLISSFGDRLVKINH